FVGARGSVAGPPAPIDFGSAIVEGPTAVGRAGAPMARVHCRNRVIAAQSKVYGVDEPGAVAVESAAKTTAACHVELAVPIADRKTDLEVDRRAHNTEYTAVARQVA